MLSADEYLRDLTGAPLSSVRDYRGSTRRAILLSDVSETIGAAWLSSMLGVCPCSNCTGQRQSVL